MDNAFIGSIMGFAGNFAPRGWAFCSGQLLSIAQNTALFSILGTTYGGNGQTTFALPDLRGCVAVSSGQGPGRSNYDLGQVGGVENTTLIVTQMPQHTHTATVSAAINANDGRADATSPSGATFAQGEAAMYAAAPDGATKMNAGAVTVQVANDVAGGSQPFSILQPFLVLNWCIALEGIFPSRN